MEHQKYIKRQRLEKLSSLTFSILKKGVHKWHLQRDIFFKLTTSRARHFTASASAKISFFSFLAFISQKIYYVLYGMHFCTERHSSTQKNNNLQVNECKFFSQCLVSKKETTHCAATKGTARLKIVPNDRQIGLLFLHTCHQFHVCAGLSDTETQRNKVPFESTAS